MSEKLPQQQIEKQLPSHEAAEISQKNIERIKELAEKEKDPSEALEELREAVNTEALLSSELQPNEKEPESGPLYQQKELKQQAYDKTMSRVRSQLSPAERQFSKFVHQRTIESVSNAGSKTLARPSGILGGGITALAGSLFILHYAKNLGFTYNYTLFIILYLAGFTIGILLEIIFSKFFKKAQ